MGTFMSFFYEVLSIIADGIGLIFDGFISGFKTIFSFSDYKKLINYYANDLSVSEGVLTFIVILVFLIIIGLSLYIIVYIILRIFKIRKNELSNEDLLEEIDILNSKVTELARENERILELKNGLVKPLDNKKESAEETTEFSDKRFPQLALVDSNNINTKLINFNNNQTLEELVDDFRCFAASKLHLYYNIDLLRVFFAGLACGKMLILQGISGTGKTSLAYAWSKFNKLTPCVASVQPSWRDRTDFFGFINDFTKKFTETPALVEIYSALYDDRIHTVILDEMNLARVEYYFAEVLSILEMPSRDEWLISLVSSIDSDDPRKLINGKLPLGGNIWYIGTINNDDSTFMVTDKVYDRAMPIDINNKVKPFECREQEAVDLNSEYLESLFQKAIKDKELNSNMLGVIEEVDNYMIRHFRISFGNRIMKQLKTFVPVFVACGGGEVDAIDYFIAKKILRKLEQQNLAYLKDEFEPFIKFLNERFGNDKMMECISYIELLKKAA